MLAGSRTFSVLFPHRGIGGRIFSLCCRKSFGIYMRIFEEIAISPFGIVLCAVVVDSFIRFAERILSTWPIWLEKRFFITMTSI